MSCEDTIHYIDVVKAKVGFSPVIWIGNVTVQFNGMQVFLGSVGGKTQGLMWGHFRDVLGLRTKMYGDTQEAVQKILNQ